MNINITAEVIESFGIEKFENLGYCIWVVIRKQQCKVFEHIDCTHKWNSIESGRFACKNGLCLAVRLRRLPRPRLHPRIDLNHCRCAMPKARKRLTPKPLLALPKFGPNRGVQICHPSKCLRIHYCLLHARIMTKTDSIQSHQL